jgi:hypothetical protein
VKWCDVPSDDKGGSVALRLILKTVYCGFASMVKSGFV